VALYYKDAEGKDWMDSVFNDTVTFKEQDEGFDGETFFLYVFVAAMAILIIMGAQYILSSIGVCIFVFERQCLVKTALHMPTFSNHV
jgi:translocon-associated protein subunit alpha